MSVGRICTRLVVTASPDESVFRVAKRMEEQNVGSVVVVNPSREPVGIVTDRDIVTRCVSRGHDPEDTNVSVVMTRDVRTVNEATPIEQALGTMAGAGTRRLVVTGGEGKIVGLLSVDDVLELLVEEVEDIGRLFRKESPLIRSTG